MMKVVGSDYAGSHWLATFLLHALEERAETLNNFSYKLELNWGDVNSNWGDGQIELTRSSFVTGFPELNCVGFDLFNIRNTFHHGCLMESLWIKRACLHLGYS